MSVSHFSRSVVSDSLRFHKPQYTSLRVHHQLPESTQTHVHWVGVAIQPSHPLLSPSPPALNLSQHQGLFQWVSSLRQVAKVLEFPLQHQSFQWLISFRIDWLDLRALPQSCPFISSLRVNTILNMCLSCSFSFSFTTYKCIPQIAFVFWVSYELYHVLY